MAVTNHISPIVITRHYQHSIEKVFNAFSQAEAIAQWIAPSETIATQVMCYDFKIDGLYRIGFTMPDGQQLFLGGVFVSIQAPTQICFTWQWESPDIHAHIQTLVTVDLLQNGPTTTLTITHENLAHLAMLERHTQGWQGTIQRLTQYLEQ